MSRKWMLCRWDVAQEKSRANWYIPIPGRGTVAFHLFIFFSFYVYDLEEKVIGLDKPTAFFFVFE